MLNPIEFQVMDQEEDMRRERARQLKKADDDTNLKLIAKKKNLQRKSRANEQRDHQTQQPFYDRLIDGNNEQRRQYYQNVDKRAERAKNVAIIKTKIEEFAEEDEAKALERMQQDFKARFEADQAMRNRIAEDTLRTSNQNFFQMRQNTKTLKQKLQETVENSPSHPCYGTIKLPEFMKQQQTSNNDKMKNMKRQLEEMQEMGAAKDKNFFMGMTDDEIMVNKTEFIQMGLI